MGPIASVAREDDDNGARSGGEEEGKEEEEEQREGGGRKQTQSVDSYQRESSADIRKGVWGHDEHDLFLKGFDVHGNNWEKIAGLVHTRTPTQVRTHAQKYLQSIKAGKTFLSVPSPGQDNDNQRDANIHTVRVGSEKVTQTRRCKLHCGELLWFKNFLPTC